MKQPLKPIPAFKKESEERKFWETEDTADYSISAKRGASVSRT